MKYGVIIPITTILSACAQTQPIVVPERISVPTWIPTPSTLTIPVIADLGQNPTWGSAIGAYNAALMTCNARLASIATLAPPSVTTPKSP